MRRLRRNISGRRWGLAEALRYPYLADAGAFRLLWWIAKFGVTRRLARALAGVAARDTHHRYVSAVAVVPPAVAAQIAAAQLDLRGTAPNHYYYPRETLHLTIARPYRVRGDVSETDLGEISEAIGAVAARTLPFRIELMRLNLSTVSVFVEVHPPRSALHLFRVQLAGRPAPHPVSRVVAALQPRLAHVNIVRLASLPSADLVRAVERYRTSPFGAFRIDRFDLVVTDRRLTPALTRLVASFTLPEDATSRT